MTTRFVFALGVSAATLAGCVNDIDLKIRNPLTARTLDDNRIVKPHDYLEQQYGLPPGSISDQATMVKANKKRLCFEVALHELQSIDLRRVEAKLVVPKVPPADEPNVQAEPPTSQTYDGLVPERRQSGSETVCTSRDVNNICQSWQTRPTYITVMVRGPVAVHASNGRICFANHGILNSATPQLSLELSVPVAGRVGMFGIPDNKEEVFTWGFLGGGGDGGGGADDSAGDDDSAGAAAAPVAAPAPAAAPADDSAAADDAPPPPKKKKAKKKPVAVQSDD